MRDSAIIGFIVFLFRKIVDIYDNSLLEKIIASVCGFFKKMSDGSVICGAFKNKFLCGSFWRESLVFKAVTAPVRLVLAAGRKFGDSVAKRLQNSLILEILDNIFNIPMREYGFIALSFSIGTAITLVASGNLTRLRIITAGFMTVLSLIMLLIPASLEGIYKTSGVLRLIGSCFNSYSINRENNKEIYHIKPIRFFCLLFFAAGLLTGFFSPAVVCIAVACAAAVILILRYTLIGVFATVFFAPIMPTMVCAGLVALTAVSFIMGLIVNKDRAYTITPMSFLITMFVALAAFSSLASFNRGKSIQIFVLYAIFAFSYFIIVNTIKTKNQWYNLVTVFAVSGLLVGLYGIYQNFFTEATALSSWVDEEMFEDIGIRVYSTFGNPNVLGQYLVLAIPVVFALCVSAKNIPARIAFFITAAVMGACLVFTWSRAAWVGIVLALGFFVIMKDRRWSTICIVALIILPFILPESIISRITSIGNMKDSSTAYRVSVWIASLRMAKDYWLGGIGLGSGAFERIYQNYALNGAGFALHSHNFYIQLVVEMGILGLIVFLAIIFLSYKQIVSIKDKNSVNKNVALAIGGALIGYLFQGMAENLWYNYRMVLIFWIYIAILQSGVTVSQKERYPVLK